MNCRKYAFTIVEILVVTVLISALFSAGFSLLRGGFSAANKGGAWLSNSLMLSNLMRQFEIDFHRATKIDIQPGTITLTCPVTYKSQLKESKIYYRWPGPDERGVIREAPDITSTFCRDKHIEVLDCRWFSFEKGEQGVQINLSVASRPKKDGLTDAEREVVNSRRFVRTMNKNHFELYSTWQ